MTDIPSRSGGSSRRPWIAVGVLLAPAVVVPIWVPLYDRLEPELFGFPFFFWFQFALIIGAVLLTAVAYNVAKSADRGDRIRHGLPPEPDGTGADRDGGGPS